MRWLIPVRLVLFIIGIVTWGYGYRADEFRVRLAGIIVLVVALLLRFVPGHWLGATEEQPNRPSGEE